MHITIRREENPRGFFRDRTEFVVAFVVKLSEEEEAIALHIGIADMVLVTIPEEPPRYYLVRDTFLAIERRAYFWTFNEAQQFENELRAQLSVLKGNLHEPGTHGRVETFEL